MSAEGSLERVHVCGQCRDTGWQIDPKDHHTADGKEWWYGFEACGACGLGEKVEAGWDGPDPYEVFGDGARV